MFDWFYFSREVLNFLKRNKQKFHYVVQFCSTWQCLCGTKL